MYCLRIYPGKVKRCKLVVLEESRKHQNRHHLLDHTSSLFQRAFLKQGHQSRQRKENLIMKIRIAIRGLERHYIDKVSIESD